MCIRGLFSLLTPQAPLPPFTDALLQAASDQFILPAIYPRLARHNLLCHLPPDLSSNLSTVTELNRERNALFLSHARSVARLLSESAHIQPVVALKGLAYLLTNVFSDPAERFLHDLDFLIPADQILAAIQALSSAGYTPLPAHLDPVAAYRHHAPPMFPPEGVTGPRVELHHAIGVGLPARILPASEILRCAQFLPSDNIYVPSPEHLVTHLLVHSQIRHDYHERIRPPLRALDDLVNLTRCFPDLDWSAIERIFHAAGQLTTLKLHLLQAHHDFDFPLPFPIRLTASERFRWSRRCLLNRHPALCHFDPAYLFMTAVSRRARILSAFIRGQFLLL